MRVYNGIIQLLWYDDMRMENVDGMTKIEMQDGYVIIPEDWVVLKTANPMTCSYAGVVEARNGGRFGVPHFVFFSHVPISQMTSSEELGILIACEEEYPDFKKIRELQVTANLDEDGNITNAKEYLAAPTIGVFEISVYGEASEFPAGAMVVKDSASSK